MNSDAIVLSSGLFNQMVEESVSSCKTEVSYTKSLALELPKLLNGNGPIAVSKKCKDVLRFSGAFIHQKPYVKFEPKKNGKLRRCELGDLLILMEERFGSATRCNAALLQLKLLKSRSEQKYSIGSSWDGEGRQLKLYTEWPRLHIAAKKYASKEYDIYPKSITPGAQYLLIRHVRKPRFVVVNPRECMLVEPPSFGMFVRSFINWQTGRPISEEGKMCGDDWSRLIWDTVDLVKECNIPKSGMKRLRSGLSWMTGGGDLHVDGQEFEADFSDCDESRDSEVEGFGMLRIERISERS